jgi:hypothetical protein
MNEEPDDQPDDQPVTIMVHEYDGEPCEPDPLAYDHQTCIHGWRLIEVYTQPMYPPPYPEQESEDPG